jgi:Clostridium P-47 protein
MNMNGWDTIFAASVSYANKALSKQADKLLTSLNATIQGELGTFTISAQIGPWEIVPGGSGQIIHVLLTLTAGTLETPDGKTYPLAGYRPIMQFSLQLLGTGAGAPQRLLFDIQHAGQLGQLASPGFVTPVGFAAPAPKMDTLLQTILINGLASGLVLQANLVSFEFASISPVKSGTGSWLTPANCTFAYYEVVSGAAGYLVIFATNGSPSGLATAVDPGLFANNASAGFAIALPLYLTNVMVPSLGSVFPDSNTSQFVVGGSPPTITLANGASLDLAGMKVGLITYYPQISSLTITPQAGAMSVSAGGGTDLYGRCSMTFTVTATNQFAFDQPSETCSFKPDANPTVQHDTSIYWGYLFGGLIALAVAGTVAAVVGDNIAGLVGGDVGSGALAAAAPTSIQFAGMQNFTTTSVSFDGALVMLAA